ncbi:MAG: hypothetical protein CMC05_01880 [Flavobacteriaceae bacterium]|nr:hypothetical protein [Flavobacteriaceae bacterium]MBD10562.1 hypothetical protein [Flavobacteriaceae bacterium]|tara:strand:- start:4380 stop:6374 length:1995 start_codon:yes stop_codon:yes gene_type:complete
MKKITFLIFLLSGLVYSQVNLQDFEIAQNNASEEIYGGFGAGLTAGLDVDPTNASNQVGKIETTAGGDVWRGIFVRPQTHYFDLTTNKDVTVDVYSTTAVYFLGRIQINQNGTSDENGSTVQHTGSGWETLTFSFPLANDEYYEFVMYANVDSSGAFIDGAPTVMTAYIDNVTANQGSAIPASTQSNVTFSVDMSEYAGSFTEVNVNGTFNGWCGSCNPMTDMGNGIYEVTLPLSNGDIEYKFTVDGWTAQEEFVGGEPCTVTNGGFTNRALTVSEDVTLDTVCWNSCIACGATPTDYNVTFSVDMSEYSGSFTEVDLNGSFNGWCGSCNPMTDMGNGIWEVTLPITEGTIQYKFTLDGWTAQEEFAGGESCTITDGGFTNRVLTVSGDVSLDTVCFNSCDACSTVEPPTIPAPPGAPTFNSPTDYSTVYSSYGEAVGLVPSAFAGASEQTVAIEGDDVKQLAILNPGGGMNFAFAPQDLATEGFTHLYFNFYYDGTEEFGKLFNYHLQGGGANIFGQMFLEPTGRSSDGWQTVNVEIATMNNGATDPTDNISLVQIVGAGGTNPWGDLYLDNIIFYKAGSLSTNDFQTADFKVFPNPTQADWNISSSNIINSIAVYDILGKQVLSLKPNSNQVVLDASSLRSGIYITKIEGENGTKTVKLVKN